jgi:endonuclease YncB( thermonuclease family)
MRQILLSVVALFLPLFVSAETLHGRVVGVTDGDTLTLLASRTEYKIRLAEIDTPEKGQGWGARASRALASKVQHEDVVVDFTEVDNYGRLVGKVWLGDRDINRELVRQGHAWAYRDYLRDATLLQDEAAAREEGAGLWSASGPVAPWLWRRGTRSATYVSAAPGHAIKQYCSDMSSCEEAYFFLTELGWSRLDGDRDGVPCESICR